MSIGVAYFIAVFALACGLMGATSGIEHLGIRVIPVSPESVGALALASFITLSFVRTLKPIEGLAVIGRKPWSCDVCMSIWTVLGWSLGSAVVGRAIPGPMTAAAAAGLCLLLLQLIRVRGAPP